ncbi:V-type ATP synthase subunit K [bacterium]|nr:V-type ATP synthase subunit K [Candidatus Elulimicrobium humile]
MLKKLGVSLAVLGAALAAGLAGAGSSIGVSTAGKTGAGLVAEDSSQFGNILLLSALPGSQAIYGLLAAVLILQNTGVLSGEFANLSWQNGMILAFAGIPVGLTCLASGKYQGDVIASGVQLIARDKSAIGQVIILAALVETFAVFGLLVSILIINGVSVG